ncbi:ABC transporter permease [Nocardiopsis ganjiahuensis]|uniref:ABC transporter permease n=1 Tax=Nocardiopsis ganjiahuensis TaxID=239984 RepID=UPI00034D7FAF|nr:ABC transporter permease [Nocardiopsis ganjiahuensis]
MLLSVRSEGRKLTTLPFVPLAVLATFAVTVGLSAIASQNTPAYLDADPALAAAFDPVEEGFNGVYMGQLGMVVLGVLAVSSEFTNTQVRTSLMAVPGRGRFLVSKALVVALMALVASLAVVPSAFVATQAALGDYGLELGALAEADVLGRLAGAVLYWTLLALLAAGATVIARNAVAPLAVLGALVLALSHVLAEFTDYAELLPDRAGQLMFLEAFEPGIGLSAVQGGLVMAAWVAGVWLLAALLFHRRDA